VPISPSPDANAAKSVCCGTGRSTEQINHPFDGPIVNDSFDEQTQESVVVPYSSLPPETLARVVESFVLREGTDYGEKEFSLETKVAQVVRQLEIGEAQIIFDPNTQTVNIVVAK
jgi:hypothetical protein